jgi:ferredoxin
MKLNGYETLICNCERTMTLDGKKVCKAAGGDDEPDVFNTLCRAEVSKFADALSGNAKVLVACTQEAPLFTELAEEQKFEGELRFANIRERAGWSTDKAANSAKIAALLADATHVSEPAGSISVTSSGQCLVYGAGQQALDAARKLNERIPTTVLLSDVGDVIPPVSADVALFKGKITKAAGRLGAFEIVVDDYAPLMPSAKQSADFVMPRDGASSTCALILDLSDGPSLFTGGHLRDGYKKVDAGDPARVMEAMFELADMAGEFEKPLYVHYDSSICAHSRSLKTGCTRCLDVCPAGAITSIGDIVEFDPIICGGCGSCSAVCPTGAASYAMPQRADLIGRIDALVSTYLSAGGKTPEVLVHDNSFGLELIAMSARFGRGLPAHVLPLGVNEITQIGHDGLLAMMAAGVSRIHLIANPAKAEELSGCEAQIELTRALVDGLGYECAINLICEADPDALEATVWADKPVPALKAHAISGVGSKRDVTRTMLGLLHGSAPAPEDIIALPGAAPYGQIIVNTETCTMCQACVGACPVNAIADSPDKPQLSFTEAACVQCGLCRTTCPEGAITLEPRYNFAASALSPTILNEEEPFACISCGKEFGTKSTIEKISAQLAGKHSMFADSEASKLIRMCDNCRIEHQANSVNDPFSAGSRPAIRRTEDYIEAERKTAAGEPLSADDFLMDDD